MLIYHGESLDLNESLVYESKGIFYSSGIDSTLKCQSCSEMDAIFKFENYYYCSDCKPKDSFMDMTRMEYLSNLDVFCSNWTTGCSVIVKKKELSNHILECSYELVSCYKKEYGCDIIDTRLNIKTHTCKATVDTVIEHLLKTTKELSHDMLYLKKKLRLNEGHLMDIHDDLNGLKVDLNQINNKIQKDDELLSQVYKLYIVTKRENILDLSLDSISLVDDKWLPDLTLMLDRLLSFAPVHLEFPLTKSSLLHFEGLEHVIATKRSLISLTLVGNKSKVFLDLPKTFIPIVATSSIVGLKLKDIHAKLFKEYMMELVQTNSAIKVYTDRCGFEIENHFLSE